MSKEKRETFHLLKTGEKFKHELFQDYTAGKEMHGDDIEFALDELKKMEGIPTE